jgi:hypothetical protein
MDGLESHLAQADADETDSCLRCKREASIADLKAGIGSSAPMHLALVDTKNHRNQARHESEVESPNLIHISRFR